MTISMQRRFAPIVLATAAVALAASACTSETADSGAEKASTSPSPSEATESASTATTPTAATTAPADEASTSDGASNPAGAGKPCATGDLSFTVSEKSQAGGYYLVTASPKSGVTCTLEGATISAGFGSAVSGDVKPSEQAMGEPITMSGSTKAYAGVNPHGGPQNGGVQFEEIIVSAHEGDMNPVSLKLPSTAEVNQPVGTNWHTDPSQAVPFA